MPILAFALPVLVAMPACISVPILNAVGFGTGGVAAGSAAAALQAGIGNVAAGSVFAVAQAIAALAI